MARSPSFYFFNCRPTQTVEISKQAYDETGSITQLIKRSYRNVDVMSMATWLQCLSTTYYHHQAASNKMSMIRRSKIASKMVRLRCISSKSESIGIGDFIGGDLVKFDLGRWLSDVEQHKAIAIYTPHEGGYEGRYLTRLKYQGYCFLSLSARGLGDPETTLTKIHPVCPAHVGKQPIARWYFPPEVDYRLETLPPDAKGLVVWIIEAKVLSKSELQFLALLPELRPKEEGYVEAT